MITIRWTAFTIALVCAIVLILMPRGGWAAFFVAALMTAGTVTHLWTWRGTEWVRDIPSDHPDTIRSLARADRAARPTNQETHR